MVTNVLPGMQAAFVDIGLSKDAFLYAGDYTANLTDAGRRHPGRGRRRRRSRRRGRGRGRRRSPSARPTGPIEEMLRKGQEVLVQVSKESLGTKGARVTSFISIPGRYVVYMPQARHVGVSRRIRDERERDRLRAALRSLKPPPGRLHRPHQRRGQGRGGVRRRHRVPVPPAGRRSRRASSRPGPPAALHEEMDLDLPRGARSLLARGGRVRRRRPRRLRQVRGLRPGAGAGAGRAGAALRRARARSSTPSASRRTSRRRCAAACG